MAESFMAHARNSTVVAASCSSSLLGVLLYWRLMLDLDQNGFPPSLGFFSWTLSRLDPILNPFIAVMADCADVGLS